MAQYRFAYNSQEQLVNIKDLIKHELNPPYLCVNCNQKLIPKLGRHREHHFAHKVDTECNYESYLHSAAKHKLYSLYSESLHKSIPFHLEVYKDITPSHRNIKINRFRSIKKPWPSNVKRVKPVKHNLLEWFDEIHLEKNVGAYRPDITLFSSQKNSYLFIEICVSSQISRVKRNSSYRIIEIIINNELDILNLERRVLSCNSTNMKFYNFRR